MTNPYNLKINQTYLVKHCNSKIWIAVKIVDFTKEGYPWGENSFECFSGPISEEFDVINDEFERECKLSKMLDVYEYYLEYEKINSINFNLENMLKFANEYLKHNIKKYQWKGWKERSKKDIKKYPNEYCSFQFYFDMTH